MTFFEYDYNDDCLDNISVTKFSNDHMETLV